MDPFCYLCYVTDMLSCLFIAALWSPAGKGLPSLYVMFIYILTMGALESKSVFQNIQPHWQDFEL